MKGQAAVEYLMTYGWAIMAILIVLAILLWLFSNIQLPEMCYFPKQQFSCDGKPQLFTDENQYVFMNIRIRNENPETVEIKKVACVAGKELPSNVEVKIEKQLLSGEAIAFTDIPCYDSDGTKLRMKGGQFTGKFYVWYVLKSDIDKTKYRIAEAQISSQLAVSSQ